MFEIFSEISVNFTGSLRNKECVGQLCIKIPRYGSQMFVLRYFIRVIHRVNLALRMERDGSAKRDELYKFLEYLYEKFNKTGRGSSKIVDLCVLYKFLL